MIKKCQSTEVYLGPGIAVGWYRVLQSYFKRPLGLILLVLMVLMGFEVGTKKPLCINSQIVNKIDRVTAPNDASASGNSELIYNCSTYRIPAFSSYFYENIDDLTERFLKIEKVALLLGLKGRLDIEINEAEQGQLKIKNNKISVSPDRLEDPEFAKLFVSVLLLQNMKFASAPFVGFLSGWLTDAPGGESAIEEIWFETYDSLGLIQKYKFKESIYNELRSSPEFNYQSMTENMLALLKSDTVSVREFKNIFSEKLNRLGLADTAKPLDLIFENLSGGEFKMDSLVALAKANKEKRIAIEDRSGLYLLPYMTHVEDNTKLQMTTRLRILLVSQKSSVNINNYFKNTDRLILFRAKTDQSDLKFQSLFATDDLTKNELSLLHVNKDFDVIQFHVPSLRFRQGQFKQIKDYFGLIKEAKSSIVQKKKLGWDSVEWSIEAQAFKPLAVFDVIQFYRVN